MTLEQPRAVAAKKPEPRKYGVNGLPSLHILMPISKSHAISQMCRENMLFHGGLRSDLGDLYSTVTDRPIAEARNHLATQFMSRRCDLAMWIDDDMVWEPASIMAMRRVMAELPEEVGIMSAICVDRKGNDLICAYKLNPVSRHFDRIRYGEFDDTAPFEVGGTGHAFTCVRRWVYEALPKVQDGWYWFFPNLSEDLQFCSRAREEAGAKVMVDPRIRVGHMGEVISVYEPGNDATIKKAARHLLDKMKEQIGEAKAQRDTARLRAIEELQRALEPVTSPSTVPAHLGAM